MNNPEADCGIKPLILKPIVPPIKAKSEALPDITTDDISTAGYISSTPQDFHDHLEKKTRAMLIDEAVISNSLSQDPFTNWYGVLKDDTKNSVSAEQAVENLQYFREKARTEKRK